MGVSTCPLDAQNSPAPKSDGEKVPEPLNWTTQQDHQNMMEQLGIKSLRPGPSGRADATNAANYDPAKANPFPGSARSAHVEERAEGHDAPRCGGSSAARKSSRTSNAKSFGRVPKDVPKVTWTITTRQADDRVVGDIPVSARQLVGTVDNSACPSIEVNIQMTLVTPAKAEGRCRC